MSSTPLRIVDVVASTGLGAFFFDDQQAIKSGAVRDGNAYTGAPLTPGYTAIRETAEAASIMLILEDGYVAVGDCASVQYSGVGGREPRLHAAALAARIETRLAPALTGWDITSFRSASVKAETVLASQDGLGRAAAYGLSQALLDAASHAAGHHIMGRVIKDEWQLPGPLTPVPLYAQTGEDRHAGVDTMVLKRVPVLPHGLINTADLVGHDGDALVEYIGYIRDRIAHLAGDPGYLPVIHLDVYGMVGAAAGGSIAATADILGRLEDAAGPHQLRIEHPLDAGSRDAQITALGALRSELAARGSQVQIIADEWANTLQDIQAFADAQAADLIQIKTPDLGAIHNIVAAVATCHAASIGPVIGGTCAETDRSARATTHIGIATGVTQMLAKPGMGINEGLTIVTNEMNRAVRLDQRLMAHRAADNEDTQPQPAEMTP
ncbi:Methylaspartate ammonia-lyase [Nostocoides japonicum T1-X7]|uniref:methylaspartate ammonia-lyase n=1 Tax=Nostocoides japonicum T1-X7 TaxID=1194083 RepID=A0A077M284_9MICO|nr:methylaspartate ammonia-lyase [Tetrasphaera japonica]CCH79152.1 Methylaspartate ammonia-lyase [Tetrasphaera japonica T1-X7]